MKHLLKTEPNTRFGVMLDSRVTIGCNAKGRSTSQKLNYYLSSCLPFLVGGNLYPGYFHIGTDDNVADDPSRLRPLRAPSALQPYWLQRFLAGNQRILDVIVAADNVAPPWNGWARLMTLVLWRSEHA